MMVSVLQPIIRLNQIIATLQSNTQSQWLNDGIPDWHIPYAMGPAIVDMGIMMARVIRLVDEVEKRMIVVVSS